MNCKEFYIPDLGEVYKCDICGNVVYVLQGGGSELVCCEEEMNLVTGDEAKRMMEKMPKPGSP